MRFFDTKQNVSFPVIVGWERGVLISWDVISRVVSEAPARVSLFLSLSSSKDFSDVDSYTARLCGFIILALRYWNASVWFDVRTLDEAVGYRESIRWIEIELLQQYFL